MKFKRDTTAVTILLSVSLILMGIGNILEGMVLFIISIIFITIIIVFKNTYKKSISTWEDMLLEDER